ncbi:MAG: hypothetical protein NZM44_03765 [Candidatus Calescibacterium sp.]|nr:hypothetical protein [Candidatus Calescibacterium sp.]MCX7759049.1 hypothetical protein [bacterium]
MDLKILVGLSGMVILVSSWIPQTWETIKTKTCSLNINFIILYTISSFLLTIYSLLIHDMVFTVLNLLAFIQSGVNLFVKLWYKS